MEETSVVKLFLQFSTKTLWKKEAEGLHKTSRRAENDQLFDLSLRSRSPRDTKHEDKWKANHGIRMGQVEVGACDKVWKERSYARIKWNEVERVRENKFKLRRKKVVVGCSGQVGSNSVLTKPFFSYVGPMDMSHVHNLQSLKHFESSNYLFRRFQKPPLYCIACSLTKRNTETKLVAQEQFLLILTIAFASATGYPFDHSFDPMLVCI